MNYESCIANKRKLYSRFIAFLESFDENKEDNYQHLLQIIKNQKYLENKEKLENFIQLLSSFLDNYHRRNTFMDKIKQIISSISEEIKKQMSDSEIFDFFSSNKLILLYLIDNKIITLDKNICLQIYCRLEKNGQRYCYFFIPEIKQFIEEDKIKLIEDELLKSDPNIFSNYDEKRRKGENDSYICYLIRNDMIDDFIVYTNKTNTSLTTKIQRSIFETNRYLIENQPNLIEYAAFFGSIKIFQYLKCNQVEMTSQLWDYSVHSNNAELFHLLEEYNVPIKKGQNKDDDDIEYKSCFLESIKCNNNDFAIYIQNNLMLKHKIDVTKMKDEVASYAFKYCNYCYLPKEYDDCLFIYLCYYKFNEVVNFLIEKDEGEFDKIRIRNFNFSNNISKKKFKSYSKIIFFKNYVFKSIYLM